MSLVALAVTFFMVEATRAFLMRRTLQKAADAAAVTGASQLDEEAYYVSGGTVTVLNPGTAETAASRSIAQRGLDVIATVDASTTRVRVRLRTDLTTQFLRFVGIDAVPVDAEAAAEPIEGPAPADSVP
ncbi:MAG: pilus assembly protein TadG-related protein [Actinomycetota bacterium]|nr:pilus assembly protein TadG-related protein [Actinomycetota bacterium]